MDVCFFVQCSGQSTLSLVGTTAHCCRNLIRIQPTIGPIGLRCRTRGDEQNQMQSSYKLHFALFFFISFRWTELCLCAASLFVCIKYINRITHLISLSLVWHEKSNEEGEPKEKRKIKIEKTTIKRNRFLQSFWFSGELYPSLSLSTLSLFPRIPYRRLPTIKVSYGDKFCRLHFVQMKSNSNIHEECDRCYRTAEKKNRRKGEIEKNCDTHYPVSAEAVRPDILKKFVDFSSRNEVRAGWDDVVCVWVCVKHTEPNHCRGTTLNEALDCNVRCNSRDDKTVV